MRFPEQEQNWFEVVVVPSAVLGVRANDEDAALQKVEYALNDKEFEPWKLAPMIGMLALSVDESERAISERVFLTTNGQTLVPRSLSSEPFIPEMESKECSGQLQLDFELHTPKEPALSAN